MTNEMGSLSDALKKAEILLKRVEELGRFEANGYQIGYIYNGSQSLLNHGHELLPYAVKESEILSGTSRIHYIKMNIGLSSPKSVLAAESLNGSTELELADSLTGGTDTTSRRCLAREFGFNEKEIDFLSVKFYGVISDYKRIYNTKDWKQIDSGSEIPYGLVKEQRNYLKIKNSNHFGAIHVKIHLIKILDDDLDMFALKEKTFSATADKQDPGRIPIIYQISDRGTVDNGFVLTMICHLGASILSSAEFRVQAKIAKSFAKRLNPGDTLDFKMKEFCGPGVRFDITEAYGKGNSPSSYGIVVEVEGTPCEVIRFADDSIFQGTSPGSYNYECGKTVVLVKQSSLVGAVSSIEAPSVTGKYAIRIHETDYLNQEPFHVPLHEIGKRGNSPFGIITDLSQRPVYYVNTLKISDKAMKEEEMLAPFEDGEDDDSNDDNYNYNDDSNDDNDDSNDYNNDSNDYKFNDEL